MLVTFGNQRRLSKPILGIMRSPAEYRFPFHCGLGFHSHPLAETCAATSAGVIFEALAELAKRARRIT